MLLPTDTIEEGERSLGLGLSMQIPEMMSIVWKLQRGLAPRRADPWETGEHVMRILNRLFVV